MTFVQQLAERLDLDAATARDVLADWVAHVRQQLSTEGQLTIPNLGVFRSFDGTVVFEPTQELARMVNNRFTGLENLTVAAGPTPPSAAAPTGDTTARKPEDQPGDEGVGIYPSPAPTEEPSAAPPPPEPVMPGSAPPREGVPPEEFAPPVESGSAASGQRSPGREASEEPEPHEETEPERGDVIPPEPVELDEKATAAEPDLAQAFPSSPASAAPARPVEPGDRAAQAPPRERPEEPERRSRWPLVLFVVLLLAIAGVVAVVLTREEPGPSPAAITEGPPPVTGVEPAEPATGPEAGAPEQEPAETPGPESEAEPPPTTPAPEETPLRGAGGIDREAGGFALIVASSTRRDYAEEVAASFREQGFRTDLLAEEVEGVTRYRVALGQFNTLEAATAARSDLAGELPEGTWVLRIQPGM